MYGYTLFIQISGVGGGKRRRRGKERVLQRKCLVSDTIKLSSEGTLVLLVNISVQQVSEIG